MSDSAPETPTDHLDRPPVEVMSDQTPPAGGPRPPQMRPPGCGCLLPTAVLGALTLAGAGQLMWNWSALEWPGKAAAVLLCLLGLFLLGLLIAFLLILRALRRLARQLARDAAHLVDTARYMTNHPSDMAGTRHRARDEVGDAEALPAPEPDERPPPPST